MESRLEVEVRVELWTSVVSQGFQIVSQYFCTYVESWPQCLAIPSCLSNGIRYADLDHLDAACYEGVQGLELMQKRLSWCFNSCLRVIACPYEAYHSR
jgi:hypothetical protein